MISRGKYFYPKTAENCQKLPPSEKIAENYRGGVNGAVFGNFWQFLPNKSGVRRRYLVTAIGCHY